ncbi:MAG: hypothetical protein QOE75_119 [Solirubrobacterales bacterium]|jgi:hypothetical protein|nr:hypothetical protein [Solirubrobacterales bacterium]
MIRNLKALGVCAIAVLAMSAVVASAAQAADDIQAGSYPATIDGVQTNENVLSNGIRSVTCAEATLTGTLSEKSKTVTINPSYSACTGNGSTTATVTTTGCSFVLDPTETVAGTNGTGTVDVVCSGSGITIDIWATGKKHSEAKLCRLVVPSQKGITGGTYHNREVGGKKVIDLNFASSNVLVNRTEGTAVNCGAATKTEGTYNGALRGSATNEGGSQIDLWVG